MKDRLILPNDYRETEQRTSKETDIPDYGDGLWTWDIGGAQRIGTFSQQLLMLHPSILKPCFDLCFTEI